MTEIVEVKGRSILQKRRPPLTRDAVFRLWRAAVKDDDKVADAVIQKVYDDMMAFDPECAESVMDLMVRRNPAGEEAFRALVKDMQALQRATRIVLVSGSAASRAA